MTAATREPTPSRTTFGTALDLTAAEMSIEAFLPADEAVAATLRELGRSGAVAE
ncbi:hypothetical protein [Micromonospora sp. WMMD736]|uniref:hypothetical protein n=1 Tax=Micromonospora sp. WMMD736 TaxID=3404112 RepID=UPI003B948ECC